jgi:hypothetical protein
MDDSGDRLWDVYRTDIKPNKILSFSFGNTPDLRVDLLNQLFYPIESYQYWKESYSEIILLSLWDTLIETTKKRIRRGIPLTLQLLENNVLNKNNKVYSFSQETIIFPNGIQLQLRGVQLQLRYTSSNQEGWYNIYGWNEVLTNCGNIDKNSVRPSKSDPNIFSCVINPLLPLSIYIDNLNDEEDKEEKETLIKELESINSDPVIKILISRFLTCRPLQILSENNDYPFY